MFIILKTSNIFFSLLILIYIYLGYHNPLKEIANLSLPVFSLELAECTLESAVAIINAASDCLTTLIINFSSVLLHYCLSCPPFVCPNLDTIQVRNVFFKDIVP